MKGHTMECDCSEEYGPCEKHANIYAVREGASLHTADELTMLLIDDLLDIAEATHGKYGCDLSVWGVETVDEAREAFSKGQRWLDDFDLAEALRDVAWQMECNSNLWINHNDGYVIAEVTSGPLHER